MGLFGGGGDDAADDANRQLQSELDYKKAETAKQIAALKEEQLAITKSKNAPLWTPNTPEGYVNPNASLGGMPGG